MSDFFENDNVKEEMKNIYDLQKDLYSVILKFPYMSPDAKWEHIETLKELLEKQQIMWTRISLSDDPEAITMKNKLKDQTEMLGFGTTDMTTIFKNMKDTLEKMQSQLKQ
jgi:hypothetical protein